MSSALKAHATITAAFRVGRSRSREERRVTKASPLLLDTLPPPAAPDPDRVALAGPGPGGGGSGDEADWAVRAQAAGAARSASSSSSRRGSGSGSGSGAGGGARIVCGGARAPGSAPARRLHPGSRGGGGCAVPGRKLRSPEEPALPPTRCTESFDGLRPHVGGAGLARRGAALRPPAPVAPEAPRDPEPGAAAVAGANTVIRVLRVLLL